MKWWNNGETNTRSIDCPGIDFSPGRMPFKRITPTRETRLKMSQSNTGRPSPFKGVLKGPDSIETRLKKSEAAYRRDNSVYRGKDPWNKGLTLEDPRVMSYVKVQRGQTRTGQYLTGEFHPGYNPERREYLRYKTRVQRLTEQTYARFSNEINPNAFPRTLAGVEGGYQLDHIKSTWRGFQEKLPPEEIAKKENLQMLPWLENLKKSKD